MAAPYPMSTFKMPSGFMFSTYVHDDAMGEMYGDEEKGER
jgi:hypothetical protein